MQLLRKILWPFSLLYGIGVYLRNLSYDLGFRTSKQFITPTICVGNLSLGGTGKTPMIEWLIRNLNDNLKIAVLSRGYRRKTSGFIVANASSKATDIGDEPLQVYLKFPEIIVAVDADRRRGIACLEEKFQPNLILLDDAFQHRKINPKISILLTAYNQLYTDDWFFPTGNLRDSKTQAKRADVIIVTKCPSGLDPAEMRSITGKIKPRPDQQVLFCTLDYSDQLMGLPESVKLTDLRKKRITVVTGIADSKPLIEFLKDQDILVEHLEYGDHHKFSEAELRSLEDKDFILTTEKDYVRSLKHLERAAYLEVQHRFLDDGRERLLSRLAGLQS